MTTSVKENIKNENNYFRNNAAHFAKSVYGSPEISKKDISIARLTVASIAAAFFFDRTESIWGQTNPPFSSNTKIKELLTLTSIAVSALGFGYFFGATRYANSFGSINGTKKGRILHEVASYIFKKTFGEG